MNIATQRQANHNHDTLEKIRKLWYSDEHHDAENECNERNMDIAYLAMNESIYMHSNDIDLIASNARTSTSTMSTIANNRVPSSTSLASTAAVGMEMNYFQSMFAGAISRSIAQTLLHPAYTYKTILQLRQRTTTSLQQLSLPRLMKGIDAQFILSLPHGAFHFFVIDQVKQRLNLFMPRKLDFLSDFVSSAISTITCSIISTPQMVLTDRLMAGVYPTFPDAVNKIMATEGIFGFYRGWWPALAQKIPSYG